ncbi:MAG: S8 family serine peptidase [Porticoccaceae bacterium]
MESTNKILCAFLFFTLVGCGPSPDSNSPPVIKDPGVLSLIEGQTSIVKLTATDADNDSITFSISAGVDKDLFTLDSATGDLAFTEAADFEQPKDTNKDNQYQLTVTASDGKTESSSDSVDLTVQITNALEGRVVDGPMADSTLFVDLNDNGTHDDNEPSGVTDAKGFFSINQPDTSGKLIAKGGRDTATGVTLSDFILAADIPQSSSASFVSVSPITTVLAQIPSDELKAGFLSKIGIKDSYQTVLETDYWAKAQTGDLAAIHAQRVNQIIGLLMQTTSSLQIYKFDSSLSLIANSLYKQDDINLANANTVFELLKIAALDAGIALPDSKLIAVANSVATINAAFTNPDLNPTDSTAIAIAAVAQQVLQINIKKLVENEITVDKFNSENNAGSLFSNISLPADATDTDNDNLADIIDPDDDNDGVLDIYDPFPLDDDKTPPTAVILTDKQSGSAPLIVNFDASNSIAGNDQNNIHSYQWDFGNGVVESVKKTQHIFPSEGTYNAQLSVVNNQGYKHSTSVSIEVSSGSASYSVSGTVTVTDNTDIDSDINDERSTLVRNGPEDIVSTSMQDFINSAQIIESLPMQLVGYLNYPAAGNDGALKEQGDLLDVYKIVASGGEIVTLFTPNASSNEDLILSTVGLFVVDGDGALVGLSTDPYEKTKVIKLPNLPGSYYIAVAFPPPDTEDDEHDEHEQHSNSSSTYKLTVDNATFINQGSNENWSMAADFVVGDIIVKRKSNCNFDPSSDLLNSKAISPLQQKDSKSGLSIYSYGNRIIDLARSAATNKSLFTRFSKAQSKPSETELKIATLMMAKEIGSHSCVEYAEPNYRRYKSLTPNDPRYKDQWHYKKINLDDAWDITTGVDSIKVAVLDTGIALGHPDLTSRHSADGYDFVTDFNNANNPDGDGIDSDPTDSCYDSHGTHVAGTVGAHTNNEKGVSGVDWGAKIMSLRVLGCEYGSDYDIAQAIRYAAGLENDSGIVVSDPADIINMSLGGADFNQTLADAVADAINAGVIIIAAAGNESTPIPSYPAALDGVVSVAATNTDNVVAGFSNFGSTIDIAAPGVGILSTVVSSDDGVITHNYEPYNGTSMASPHIAGVASLMKSVYSDMTPDDFDAILVSGKITDDLGDSGRDDYFGHGLINAKKAVDYAKQINDGEEQIPVIPVLGLNYSSIDFASFHTEIVITASNIGTKNSTLTISGVETADSFVTVTAPSSGSEDGLGDYTIRIDRADLSPGVYSSTVKFQSNGGEKTLPVIFRVLEVDQRFDGNAGNIYLHLANTEKDEVTKINVPEPINGKYSFNFPYVGPGNYTLKAGNDLDNNGVLCQGAEGCGQYGGGNSVIIEIGADTKDIDFSLRY